MLKCLVAMSGAAAIIQGCSATAFLMLVMDEKLICGEQNARVPVINEKTRLLASPMWAVRDVQPQDGSGANEQFLVKGSLCQPNFTTLHPHLLSL